MLKRNDLEKLKSGCVLLGMDWGQFEAVRTTEDLDAVKALAKLRHRAAIKKLHTTAEAQAANKDKVTRLNSLREIVDGLEPGDFAHMQTHRPHVRPNMDHGRPAHDVMSAWEEALRNLEQAQRRDEYSRAQAGRPPEQPPADELEKLAELLRQRGREFRARQQQRQAPPPRQQQQQYYSPFYDIFAPVNPDAFWDYGTNLGPSFVVFGPHGVRTYKK